MASKTITDTSKTRKPTKKSETTAAPKAEAVAKPRVRRTGTTRAKKLAGASIVATPEQREIMIREAAYFIAEKHGFDPNRATDDWLTAEAQIDSQLAG